MMPSKYVCGITIVFNSFFVWTGMTMPKNYPDWFNTGEPYIDVL